MSGDDHTIEFGEKFNILEYLDKQAGSVAPPKPAAQPDAARRADARQEHPGHSETNTLPPVSPAEAEPESPLPDELAPLPQPGDPYKAHSRVASRPVPTLFFLARQMLPDGYSYGTFERVYFQDSGRPGAAPLLVVRFNGSEVMEAVMEGRNLLPLATYIGRHLVHWIWEMPERLRAADDSATVIRSITFRLVEV
jgi:hypothetical protein